MPSGDKEPGVFKVGDRLLWPIFNLTFTVGRIADGGKVVYPEGARQCVFSRDCVEAPAPAALLRDPDEPGQVDLFVSWLRFKGYSLMKGAMFPGEDLDAVFAKFKEEHHGKRDEAGL